MTTFQKNLIADLPGADLIRQGLDDRAIDSHSIPSCAVRIAQPRLTSAGLLASPTTDDITVELDLYTLLATEGDRAYTRYNAILREIVSFECALDHRMTQQQCSHSANP